MHKRSYLLLSSYMCAATVELRVGCILHRLLPKVTHVRSCFLTAKSHSQSLQQKKSISDRVGGCTGVINIPLGTISLTSQLTAFSILLELSRSTTSEAIVTVHTTGSKFSYTMASHKITDRDPGAIPNLAVLHPVGCMKLQVSLITNASQS